MNLSFANIRWLRIMGGALAVMALSIVILTVITSIYALGLAFQARGAPDQAAINQFAATISRWLMPWLEVVLTFVVAVVVVRKTGGAGAEHGLFIGILAGLLSLAVPLAIAGRLSAHNWGFFLAAVALGWLGGLAGQKKAMRAADIG